MTIRDISSFADYFIICSGTSIRQTQSVAGMIQEAMKKAGQPIRGVEGEAVGRWILLDYYTIIVHVFLDEVRPFYALEKLWSDAPLLRIDDSLISIAAMPG